MTGLKRNAPKPKVFRKVTLGKREGLFSVEYLGQKQSPWNDERQYGSSSRHYLISLSLNDGDEWVSFDYWNSPLAEENGERPDALTLYELISEDATMPKTEDGVFEEFSDMKPSTCRKIAEWAGQLDEWLTENDWLAEDLYETVRDIPLESKSA